MTPPENDHQDTQAQKPLEPWEQLGFFRLDREPHRGGLLRWAARTSFGLTIFSCCLLGLPVLVALPLGLAACISAQRDLALMRKGLMDREGWDQTLEARYTGLMACGLCCLVASMMLALLIKVLSYR